MINKGKCLFLVLSLSCGTLSAQRFTESQQLDLPDSVTLIQAEWVDMNNDGLLDILVIAENSTGQYFYIFKNDTVSGFSFMRAQSTGFTDAIYQIHDFDGDNRMDVAVTGIKSSLPSTSILKSLGGFQFQEIPQNLEIQATAMHFADFNNDGKRELILSGEDSAGPFLNIYTHLDNTWEVVNDSLKIKATAILPFDFDGDLFTDLVISGVDNTGAAYLAIQFTDGDFKFTRTYAFPDAVNGTIEIADISDDGWFDLLVGGVNDNGVYKTYRVLNLHNTFPVDETTIQLEKPRLFVADSDIDGIVDYSLLGYELNDTINVIQQSGSPEDILPHKGLIHQRFGDLEKDGDLDFFQIVDNGIPVLKIFTNTTATENEPPGESLYSIGAPIYGRQFIFWDKAADDHTNQLSLTYDLAIWNSTRQVFSGEFDLEVNRRLTVSHGNMGPNNFTLLKLPNQEMEYSVQTVDNSFHVGEYTCKGRLNSGGGNGGELCEVPIRYDDLDFCSDEEVDMKTTRDVYWFSFADGYLGKTNNLSFVANKSDTLFYFDRDSLCGFIQVYNVKVADSLVRESFSKKLVCLDEEIEFSVEADWDSVAWSSSQLGFISHESSFTFKALEKDTVQAYLLNRPSCVEIRKTEVIISIPEVTVNGEVFQIMKGSSVQLEASGGAHYTWSPPTGLSASDISNPVASPASTTEYAVTASDSIGCKTSKKILVKVEQTAFIPSLFTPNQDGNNDYLKVYGLTSTNGFTLKIYNREGNIVFETADPASNGWDGTKSGAEQPSGVYYWKVEGTYSSGSKLLLNGKSSGSVVLMR